MTVAACEMSRGGNPAPPASGKRETIPHPARLPLGNPGAARIDALMVRLKELGFDEWGAKPACVQPRETATIA
jgi:hypothetical protein